MHFVGWAFLFHNHTSEANNLCRIIFSGEDCYEHRWRDIDVLQKVVSPVASYFISEITSVDRRTFQMIPVSSLETSLTDLDQIRDVYDRLAYGGTPHEPKK